MALCGSWGVGARRGGLPRRRAAERSERHGFCGPAKHTLLRVLHGGHTGPPRREKVAGSVPLYMGGCHRRTPPASSTHAPPGGERAPLTAVTQVFYNTCVTA